MDTRPITTSQPATACDVCGRNLLRGEEADVFLASGQRRLVCDLCLTRAAEEGWQRESDGDGITMHPVRRRRGRGLFGRLRERREPIAGERADGELLDSPPLALPDDAPQLPLATAVAAIPEPRRNPRHVRGVPARTEVRAALAMEAFNRGSGPRRVAGVARSLGAPWVAVRALSPTGSVVSLVVAWELCWYRWEVDLGEEDAEARLAGQGLELDELPELDRHANAQADERGELHPLVAAPGVDV